MKIAMIMFVAVVGISNFATALSVNQVNTYQNGQRGFTPNQKNLLIGLVDNFISLVLKKIEEFGRRLEEMSMSRPDSQYRSLYYRPVPRSMFEEVNPDFLDREEDGVESSDFAPRAFEFPNLSGVGQAVGDLGSKFNKFVTRITRGLKF